MAINYGFFPYLAGSDPHDRSYTTILWAKFFNWLFPHEGVVSGIGNNLAITATGTPDMYVHINTGTVIAQGFYWLENTASYPVPITAAHSTYSRIDLVVAKFRLTGDAYRDAILTTHDGTPAASPVAPTATVSADVVEIVLGQVTVAAGATQITTANITAAASQPLCGFIAAKFGKCYTNADGGLNAGGLKVTAVADPSSGTDCENFQHVAAAISTAIAGVAIPAITDYGNWKRPVVAASTAPVTLANLYNGQSLDGVTLATGERIFLKDQTDGTSGIYVVKASGAPDRATDFDSAADALGASVPVIGGTVNGGTSWRCTNTSITLGTTVLVFAKYLLDKSSIASTTGTVQCGSLGARNTDSAAILFRRSGVYKVRIYTPSGDSDQSAKTAQIKYGSSTLNLYGGSSGGSFGTAEEITITAPTYLSLANNDLTSTWMVLQITNADGWM